MKERTSVLAILAALALLAVAAPTVALTTATPYEDVSKSTTGPVPPPWVGPKVRVPSPEQGRGVVLYDVPAYEWRHGCGPTAVGMVVGYYDSGWFDNLIPGNASTQTEEVDQAIASERDALDAGHYEDYSQPIDDPGTGYLPDRSEDPPGDEHEDDCIADFMRTSWSSIDLYYGWSYSIDIEPAFTQYFGLRYPGFTATAHWYKGAGEMTWDLLVGEIDAGRPMVFLVDTDGDAQTDHFVTIVGYREDTGQQYGCLDTWAPADVVRWCDFSHMAFGQPWGIDAGWTFGVPNTIHVDPLGGGDFVTIQEAIDAAGPGDEIELAPGTYTGSLNRDLDTGGLTLRIVSSAGPDDTIVDCQQLGRGFNFHTGEQSTTLVEGLTIRNGQSTAGGGVRCFLSSSPTLRNIRLEDCVSTGSGGGILAAIGSAPRIEDAVILDCSAAVNGGGISLAGTSPHISNCTLVGNGAAGSGGGIYFGTGSAAELHNTIVASSSDGGGVFCESGVAPTIEHNCFYDNTEGDGNCPSRGDNVYLDPIFCEATSGDLTLRSDSPCLPDNNAWGELVGALGDGNCGTGMEEDVPLAAVRLLPAMPNPSVGPTLFMVYAASPVTVNLTLYDASGRVTRRLLDGARVGAGLTHVRWDGSDEHGAPVASGVYFCKVETNDESVSRKIVLVR